MKLNKYAVLFGVILALTFCGLPVVKITTNQTNDIVAGLSQNAARQKTIHISYETILGASEAKAGIKGNALTPFTQGFDGWTLIGSTAGTGQANCGSLHGTSNPGSCYYYVNATGSDGGATFTGTSSGTNLTVSGVTGTIVLGQTVNGNACVPSNTTIVSGGPTVYVTSKSTTCSGNSLTTASDCTVIAAPCLTIVHAMAQMRPQKPDHLNIHCGDTIPFNTSDVMIANNVGLSATQPSVITTYCDGLSEGNGPRPQLQAGPCVAHNGNGGFQIFASNVAFPNYLMVSNLWFYSETRDPINNPGAYDPNCYNSQAGFNVGNGASNWLLLEGNRFDSFSGATVQLGGSVKITNFLFRRNIIVNQWNAGGGSNGILANGVSLNGNGTDGTWLFEENIMAQNGWNTAAQTPISSISYSSITGNVTIVSTFTTGNPQGGPITVAGVTGTGANLVNGTFTLGAGTTGTTLVYPVGTGQSISGLSGGTITGIAAGSLQHCVYFGTGSDNVQPAYPLATTRQPAISVPAIYRGNFSLQCADSDQIRMGGEIQFNAWIGNPGCASIGGPIVWATDNLCTENHDFYVSGIANGAGFDMATGDNINLLALPTRPQNVINNIFTNNRGTNQTAAVNLQGLACNPSLGYCTIPSTQFNGGGNYVCNWTGGGGIPSQSPTEGAILSLDNTSLVGGGGGMTGIWPGIKLTGGSGTNAIATVVVGAGGNITSVNIQQFGGVGGYFVGSVTGGQSVLTVSNRTAGAVIYPSTPTVTTNLVDAGNPPNGQARTITGQITSTEPGGALNGNGTYQLSGTLSSNWNSLGAVFNATGNGTASLTVNSVTIGALAQNQVIIGPGVPPTTSIIVSGGGGAGVYTTSNPISAVGAVSMTSGPVSGYPSGQAESFPNPTGGTNFVIGDTLAIPGGNSVGQVPGLSGASINVLSVAHNNFTSPTANTVMTSSCAGMPGPNPNITVASYDASLGGAGTINDYVASVLAQHKSNADGSPAWLYKWSAYAIVNAFKAAYGQAQNAPVYQP